MKHVQRIFFVFLILCGYVHSQVTFIHHEMDQSTQHYLVLLNSDFIPSQSDSLIEVFEQPAILFNLGPARVCNWDSIHPEPKMFRKAEKVAPVLSHPILSVAAEMDMKDIFYRTREINPSVIYYSSATKKDTNASVHLVQIKDKSGVKRMHIIADNMHIQDELYIGWHARLREYFGPAEILLQEQFLYSFFKEKLAEDKFAVTRPMLQLSAQETPVYLPNLRITGEESALIKQLFKQWPRIRQAMLQDADIRHLENSRRELLNSLRLETSSSRGKLVILTKLLLQTGFSGSISELTESIEQIEITSFIQRITKVISNDQFMLFWLTRYVPDDQELLELKSIWDIHLVNTYQP